MMWMCGGDDDGHIYLYMAGQCNGTIDVNVGCDIAHGRLDASRCTFRTAHKPRLETTHTVTIRSHFGSWCFVYG